MSLFPFTFWLLICFFVCLLLISEESFKPSTYYSVRDVERIPKGLRVMHEQLVASSVKGGILVLDSDLPDSLMNIVFLFDYLVHASEFSLLDIGRCVLDLERLDSKSPDSTWLDFGDIRTRLEVLWLEDSTRLETWRLEDSTRLEIEWLDSMTRVVWPDSLGHCVWIDIFKMTRKKLFYPMYFTALPAVSAGVTLHFYLLSSTCMAVVKIHTIDRQKHLHQTFHPILYNFRFWRYYKFYPRYILV